MSNGSGVETPQTRIATAQATLSLAVRLNSEVLAGRLRSTIYQREVHIITGGPGLMLPPDYGANRQDLNNGTQNLVLLSLGASALILDETLDEVFGKPETDIQSRRGMRIMVNQFRNAFAHNPWRPRWKVWPKYRSVYPVYLADEHLLDFDATNLDGQPIKPEDVGGLEAWVKILKHCENIVPQ
jgi:hypothetical protein